MRSRQEILEGLSESMVGGLVPEELPYLTLEVLLDIRAQQEATNELLIQLIRVGQGLPLD